MSEIVPIPLIFPVISCFPDQELRNLNWLILIPFRLAMRTGCSPREAPAIQAAGRAASPTAGGACPILLPGR
jgi:hypothetical protein